MYCSIDEAWNNYSNFKPHSHSHKNNSLNNSHHMSHSQEINDDNDALLKDFKHFLSLKNKADEPIVANKKIEHFNESLVPTTKEMQQSNMNHQYFLDHISSCEECSRMIYKRYNYGRNNNILNLITDENKDLISVVLIGILTILILHLFNSK